MTIQNRFYFPNGEIFHEAPRHLCGSWILVVSSFPGRSDAEQELCIGALDEFYKKGCQEKSSASTGRDSFAGATLAGRAFSSPRGNMMKKRIVKSAGMACVLFCMSLGFASAQAATQKSTTNNRSDMMLFQEAQKALKQSNYAEGRSLLQTLINTYPDSNYVPRAKLSIADSWYSERAFKQAEAEYRDLVTFFPNRPEVAEAQRRISSIHKNTGF